MMQPRDPRYELIKPIKYIKKSVVAADLGKKVNRFSRLTEHVEDFVVKDLLLIGRFCNLTAAEMFKLVEMEIEKKKNKTEKKDTLS